MRGKFVAYAVIVMMLTSLASWGSMVRRASSGGWHSGYSGGGWATGGGGGHK